MWCHLKDIRPKAGSLVWRLVDLRILFCGAAYQRQSNRSKIADTFAIFQGNRLPEQQAPSEQQEHIAAACNKGIDTDTSLVR